MHWAAAYVQLWLSQYGLLAVAGALLLENFGLPLPGELALLAAGYSLRQGARFDWLELLVVASLACLAGQVIGYGVGRFAGDWVRRRLHLGSGRRRHWVAYFERFGVATVVLARFVAGLRIIAGPVAGVYHMPWSRFIAASALGALAWVSVISGAGLWLGAHWPEWVHVTARLDLLLILAVLVAFGLALHRFAGFSSDSPPSPGGPLD